MSFLRILAGLVPALALVHGPPARAQENPIELEGLVVTGSPTPRPFDAVTTHVTVLEGEELRARGVSRVLDALREVPGVQLVQGGSPGSITSVFLRGGESDYVLVLVDGVQVNQPGGAFDFSSLGTADVERIEVVRGPASALYGSDAVAGVIHVITRTGSGPVRGSVRARAGSFGAREGSVAISGGSQRTGYGLTLARTSGDGILELNNGHRSTVLTGAVRFRPDDGTAGRLSVRLTERVYHFPTDGVGNVVDANAFTFEDQASVGVSLNRRLAGRLDLQAIVGVNGTDGGTDDAPDGPADTLGTVGFTSLDHVRRTSADVRANLRIAGGVATLGWELEEERQRSFTETRGDFGTSSDR
ncbi:MAG TPA: TonB-dependent receptor plug domain-containing protein, partial [Longimicrobiales bacterium]|nr:TonB-dependent receptor plug domain-containing protein [Longimicrobiales bacterium]